MKDKDVVGKVKIGSNSQEAEKEKHCTSLPTTVSLRLTKETWLKVKVKRTQVNPKGVI